MRIIAWISDVCSSDLRALHVSQPSVSKVLHHTQLQLGLTLFTLVRGRLVATDEAHALFVEVSEIVQRLTSLQKTVSNIRNVGGGHIRLGAEPSLGRSAEGRLGKERVRRGGTRG